MKQPFTIIYESTDCKVEPLNVKGNDVYRVFVNGRIIILAKSERQKGKTFWMSVPEGDEDLAERLGSLIETHDDK